MKKKNIKHYLVILILFMKKRIQRILLEDGVVVLTIYVYGGNCMYLNMFKELEVTKDVPLQYKVEINQ